MQALLGKLMVRGLTPGDAPWKTLLKYRMQKIRPKKGGKWPTSIHFILYATKVHGSGSDI